VGDLMDSIWGRTLRVLFVDDNRINRRVAAQLLKHMDLDVTEAEDGYEAIQLLKTESFDLIFMDVMMPGIDGYQTAEIIRQKELISSDVPIFAVTANEAEMSLDEALEVGMNGLITKPLRKEEVYNQLKPYFEKETAHDIKRLTAIVFDKDAFEKMYSEVFLRQEIIASFLSQTQKNQHDLKQAFEHESCEEIKERLVYMKGLFKYLHGLKMIELIDTLMKLCKEDNFVEMLQIQDLFIENYDELVEVLRDYEKTL
jgi:CheY-like chemotaxis protein